MTLAQDVVTVTVCAWVGVVGTMLLVRPLHVRLLWVAPWSKATWQDQSLPLLQASQRGQVRMDSAWSCVYVCTYTSTYMGTVVV